MMNPFELITLKSGIKTLRSVIHKETFHPTTGPFREASILHTEQQRLVERCARSQKFIIWDIGFGAAANSIAAISALKETCQNEIEIHSFDKTTSPIEFTLSHANELEYVVGYEALIQQLLVQRRASIRPGFEWRLHLADFSELIKDKSYELPAPHAIFFDPYSAATNPEMWTLELFRSVWDRLDPEKECIFTNYTRSTAVRVALLMAGFYVGVGCVVGDKAETTMASNQLGLLNQPLDHTWLKRVRNSLNSAPLRVSQYSQSRMSEEDFIKLQNLPQFAQPGASRF